MCGWGGGVRRAPRARCTARSRPRGRACSHVHSGAQRERPGAAATHRKRCGECGCTVSVFLDLHCEPGQLRVKFISEPGTP